MPLFGVISGVAKLVAKGVKKLAITKTSTGRTPVGNLLNKLGVKKKGAGTPVMQTTAASMITEKLTGNDGIAAGLSRRDFKEQKRASDLQEENLQNKKQEGFVYLIYAAIAAVVIGGLAFLFGGRKGRR